MPSYLVQVSYSTESLAALIKKPQNRVEVVSKSVEKLGGKIEGGWFSFGDYDVTVIVEMPDNVSAAALSMAFGAGGGCKSVKTTPLISMEESQLAMKKAGTSGYKPAT
jgi:uncharacterized protein with GYD domain